MATPASLPPLAFFWYSIQGCQKHEGDQQHLSQLCPWADTLILTSIVGFLSPPYQLTLGRLSSTAINDITYIGLTRFVVSSLFLSEELGMNRNDLCGQFF